MNITGDMLIGATAVHGSDTEFRATNPATGEALQPSFGGGGQAEVDKACALAGTAFDTYRETTPEAAPGSLRPSPSTSWNWAIDWSSAPWPKPACRAAGWRASAAAPSASCGCSPTSSASGG